MKLSFHGAAQMVTGSKHLLELRNGLKVLLDCGLFQGNPKTSDALNRDWGFEPAEISYVLLSHAHIDHCGLIPKLVADGFRGKIYCTPATMDLVRILLLDSAFIHESDVHYVNKRRLHNHQPPVEALYTVREAERCFQYFETVKYDQTIRLNDSLEFSFTDVGHILGSAAVHVTARENGKEIKLSFSGDVGRYNDELLNSPVAFRQSDYLILESTYGSTLHEDINLTANKLLETIVDTCVKKRGKLVIPSFSVGRTQELIYLLNRLEINKKLPDLDIFIDSPMSVEATQVMKNHMDELNHKFQEYRKIDSQPFDFKRLHYIKEASESKALNFRNEPCVIISASGMADAGRVKHHIKNTISDKRNTILLVGYCEPNSLGGKLLRGYSEVTIFGEPFKVNAEIRSVRSMSAHGDYDDLCQFIACQDPKQVKQLFLVHGELEVQQIFQGKLLKKGFPEVVIPQMHQAVHLA